MHHYAVGANVVLFQCDLITEPPTAPHADGRLQLHQYAVLTTLPASGTTGALSLSLAPRILLLVFA